MQKIYLIVVVFLVLACTNDDNAIFEDNADLTEALLEEESIDGAEIPLEMSIWAESIFSPANKNKVIIMRSESDDKTGEKIYTTRFVLEEEFMQINTPRIKTRGEGGADETWTSWGKICGKWDAVKFGTFVEKEYGDTCYETRLEPIAGEDCKQAYHRKCKD